MTNGVKVAFLLGIMRRSGTVFAGELLERHPDCRGPARPVHEDYLLANAEHLVAYADALYQNAWNRAGARRTRTATRS